MKTIAFFNNIHSSAIWHRLAAPLREEGIELLVYGFGGEKELFEAIERGAIDILLTSVSSDMPGFGELCEAMLQVPVRIGLGSGFPAGFSTFPDAEVEEVGAYFRVLSRENFQQGLRRLAGLDHALCREVATSGIYHPDAKERFTDAGRYRAWLQGQGRLHEDSPVAGIIMHYSQLAEENHADIDFLIRELEKREVVPFCVFCDGIQEVPGDREKRYPWFGYFNGCELRPDVVLNALMGRLIASPDDREMLRRLDMPVVQLVRNFTLSPEQWLKDPVGISAMSLTHSLVQPEMFGAIDPVMIAGSMRDSGESRAVFRAVPIPERIGMVVGRT